MPLTYGAANTSFAIQLSGLPNASLRQTAFVDNTSSLFVGAFVQLNIKTAGSGVNTSLGYIDVFSYGTATGGASYNGLTSGIDGTITSSINLRPIGRIAANVSGTVCNGLFSVAPSLGGGTPRILGYRS